MKDLKQSISNKEFWSGGIIGFFKLLFSTLIYLSVLIGGSLLAGTYFGEVYGVFFLPSYLILTFLFFYRRDIKKVFLYCISIKKRIRAFDFKNLGYKLRLLFKYLLIFLLITIPLFLVGVFILSLSATTIIIILLILILLK